MIPKSDLQKLTDANLEYTFFDPLLTNFICGWNPGAKEDFILDWDESTNEYSLSVGSWRSVLNNMDQVVKYIQLYYSVFG